MWMRKLNRILFGLVCFLPVPLTQAAEVQQPNIILFLVADMGWTDCGAYGSQYYEPPNVGRIAAGSMRFTQAYIHPCCSPSRASILTGEDLKSIQTRYIALQIKEVLGGRNEQSSYTSVFAVAVFALELS